MIQEVIVTPQDLATLALLQAQKVAGVTATLMMTTDMATDDCKKCKIKEIKRDEETDKV